jgi:hypothetical protein
MGKAKRFMTEGDTHEQGFTWYPPSFSGRSNGKLDKDARGVQFDRQKRFHDSRPTTPGPHEYDPERKFHTHIVKFTNAKRFSENDGTNVGFHLNLDSFRSPNSKEVNRNNSSKFGSSARWGHEPDGELTPSVHDYTTNSTTLKKGIKLGKAHRFKDDDYKIPGPGDHENRPPQNVMMGKFHKYPRFQTEPDSQKTPGPQYETFNLKEKKTPAGKFNKQKRFESSDPELTVGPASYSPNVPTTAGGRVKLVTAWGKPPGNDDTETGPGPNYAPKEEKIKGGAIGKTKRWKEPEMRPY